MVEHTITQTYHVLLDRVPDQILLRKTGRYRVDHLGITVLPYTIWDSEVLNWVHTHLTWQIARPFSVKSEDLFCLLLFYVLATSKVISGRKIGGCFK